MADRKMVILRGNSAKAGKYPDEQGKTPAWPKGALHVKAATDYAEREGYEPIVLDVPGQPQSRQSPQAKAALKAFHDDKRFARSMDFPAAATICGTFSSTSPPPSRNRCAASNWSW